MPTMRSSSGRPSTPWASSTERATTSATPSAPTSGMERKCLALSARSPLVSCGLGHAPAQARRPHVGPDLLHVRQTLLARAGRPFVAPTGRVLPVGRPDRVLLLVVHDHLVRRRRLCVLGHLAPPLAVPSSRALAPRSSCGRRVSGGGAPGARTASTRCRSPSPLPSSAP